MKLEPKQNGTWMESVTIEVNAFNGMMEVVVIFDTYNNKVILQPIANAKVEVRES